MESLFWVAGIIIVGWIILSLSAYLFRGGMFTTAVTGLGVLLLISTVTGGGSILGVNAVTASAAVVLGAPGVIGMLLAKLITFI